MIKIENGEEIAEPNVNDTSTSAVNGVAESMIDTDSDDTSETAVEDSDSVDEEDRNAEEEEDEEEEEEGEIVEEEEVVHVWNADGKKKCSIYCPVIISKEDYIEEGPQSCPLCITILLPCRHLLKDHMRLVHGWFKAKRDCIYLLHQIAKKY